VTIADAPQTVAARQHAAASSAETDQQVSDGELCLGVRCRAHHYRAGRRCERGSPREPRAAAERRSSAGAPGGAASAGLGGGRRPAAASAGSRRGRRRRRDRGSSAGPQAAREARVQAHSQDTSMRMHIPETAALPIGQALLSATSEDSVMLRWRQRWIGGRISLQDTLMPRLTRSSWRQPEAGRRNPPVPRRRVTTRDSVRPQRPRWRGGLLFSISLRAGRLSRAHPRWPIRTPRHHTRLRPSAGLFQRLWREG